MTTKNDDSMTDDALSHLLKIIDWGAPRADLQDVICARALAEPRIPAALFFFHKVPLYVGALSLCLVLALGILSGTLVGSPARADDTISARSGFYEPLTSIYLRQTYTSTKN